MTDQDHDGSHIKGLAINAIAKYWPWYLRENRVKQFITPIVRVKIGTKLRDFFSD